MKPQQYNMLILTDHSKHSSQNSLYQLSVELLNNPHCGEIDIASKATIFNTLFFKENYGSQLLASKVDQGFQFHQNGASFTKNLRKVNIKDYDVIWLRLPPPLSDAFLNFLQEQFKKQLIINAPLGIKETGSKAFLLNLKAVCPPIQLCQSWEDIDNFKQKFPIVLKPLQEYGGKGIIKIDGDSAWNGNTPIGIRELQEYIRNEERPYLAMKFLKNVGKGDKRIVVVDGQVIGASLRLPPNDSWICNAARGGYSIQANIEEAEKKIIKKINPLLKDRGIIIYGIDTLVDDNGIRVLSEINTTSIGGLIQMEQLSGQKIIAKTSDLIWSYINKVV